MAKLTYKKVQELDLDDFKKMGKTQRKEIVRQVRELTKIRMKQFEKAKSVFSPALKNFEKEYEEMPLSRMTKNDLLHEFALHQQFHKAKTSTVEGARKVATQQDFMIFGESEKNPSVPAHRMKAQQREKFWSVYDEFFRTYKDSYARFKYSSVWEQLGEMHVKGKIKSAKNPDTGKMEINTDDLAELLRLMEEKELEEALEENATTAPNVYSGRRST